MQHRKDERGAMDENADYSAEPVNTNENADASGDEETEDGLNELDEETRRGAEDIPLREKKQRDVPVFERAERDRDDG